MKRVRAAVWVGGRRWNLSGCTYGRLERGRFAGSAGDTSTGYPARGGGRIEVFADVVQIDGAIQTDGQSGNSYSGAGGSIHIEALSLSGTGNLNPFPETKWLPFSSLRSAGMSVMEGDPIKVATKVLTGVL